MFLAAAIKRERGDYALLVVIAASVMIFFYALAQLTAIADFLNEVMERLPIDETYLLPLLKMLGITYVADFSASLCREAGHSAVANQIEIFAKLAVIALGIPELYYLMEVLDGFLA